MPGRACPGFFHREEVPRGLVVDAQKNIYVAGYTAGNLFELNGGSNDAFVFKLDTNLNLVWGTQLGASTTIPNPPALANVGAEQPNGIGIDEQGNVFAGGVTNGNFADTFAGGSDIIIFKLDKNGDPVWGFQLGANTRYPGDPVTANQQTDSCQGFTVDPKGHSYCVGITLSHLGEAVASGYYDMYVLQIKSTGQF